METLPIDLVAESPLIFRWQQALDTPVGRQVVDQEGHLPAGVDAAVAALIAEARALRAFKAWVHAYLDARGVPGEFPDGPHTREGCRVGDRLDYLVARLGEVAASAPPKPPVPTAQPQPARRGK